MKDNLFYDQIKIGSLSQNKEQVLSAEEFCELTSTPDTISKIKSVTFTMSDAPNDFGSFKVAYKSQFEDTDFLNIIQSEMTLI
ncbi:MAG: hypothetical protein IJ254_11130 [Succinivibrio sp.]|nr:hypothetical protein [Succinivibrio sp.]